MKPTWTIVILFAGIVSAVSAGRMIGDKMGDALTADFRNLEARQREEMQRFRDAEAVRLERARVEDQRCVREIQKRIDAAARRQP